MSPQQRAIVPIYTTRGDAEAFLVYPYLYNRLGEWVGWVTAERQVYSVLGFFVGEMTAEPRIIRKRITSTLKPRKSPPSPPARLPVPATIPLPPLMGDLRFGQVDVLLDEPERLHTLDAGEQRQDID
ncbi:MAG TPA: hypothetical protein VMC09_10820 [Anaerolineales bacterium]|nr:hypothetical protein [Anaerolineales bacterium]